MLPNWKPVPLMDICSDKEKTVIEVLGQLRVPPTLKIRIRLVKDIKLKLFFKLNNIRDWKQFVLIKKQFVFQKMRSGTHSRKSKFPF